MYMYTLSISMNINSLTEMVISVFARSSGPLILSRNCNITLLKQTKLFNSTVMVRKKERNLFYNNNNRTLVSLFCGILPTSTTRKGLEIFVICNNHSATLVMKFDVESYVKLMSLRSRRASLIFRLT